METTTTEESPKMANDHDVHLWNRSIRTRMKEMTRREILRLRTEYQLHEEMFESGAN